MRPITINLQIVRNLGNYETLRLGAEWTPDSNQTLTEAMTAGMAELNATADMLTGKKRAPAAGGMVPKDATPGLPKGEAVVNEEQAAKLRKEAEAAQAPAAPAAQAPAPALAAPQPDEFDALNAERDGEKRELMTLVSKKFNTTLGRIAAGVKFETVFDHYRFDADALAILRAFCKGERVTLKSDDSAFPVLIKAIEEKRNIENICKAIQFADKDTAAVWDCACKIA